METDIIICDCHSEEHQLIFRYDNDNEIYVSVFLKEFSFFNRLVEGIKYIFGYKCVYGHFEETLITKNNVDKLKSIINKIK